MDNRNPKLYIEVQKQGLKIQFANVANYQIARAMCVDAIKAIDQNMVANSSVQEKSDIIMPDNGIQVVESMGKVKP
jgi:hypothetical protein